MGEVERLRARFARLLIALLWANVALLLIGTPSGGPAQANLTAMGAALDGAALDLLCRPDSGYSSDFAVATVFSAVMPNSL